MTARTLSEAARQVNNIFSSLSSVMRYAIENRVIEINSLKFWIKPEDVEIEGATPEEIDALIGATDDPRYRVAILLGSEAGLRVGEIRALRWQDINEIGETILVCRNYDTSGNLVSPKNYKHRLVPLSEKLADALEDLEQTGDTVLTQLPWLTVISEEWRTLVNLALQESRRGIGSRSELARAVGCSYAAVTTVLSGRQKTSSLVEPISEALGVIVPEVKLTNQPPMKYTKLADDIQEIYRKADVAPKMIWHSFRHAFCTSLAAKIPDVKVIMELAGHQSVETTLRYIHTSLAAKKSAIATVFGSPKRRRRKSKAQENGPQVVHNTSEKGKAP
ncbi:MAG: site-specific integrase, partial [Myxococcales bacterium]|nr:site-specific integrase [Myxococcales bacterium]